MVSTGANIVMAASPAWLAANPALGAFVLTASALFDSQVLYPALAGRGRKVARPDRQQGIPTGSNEAGAPRVWAIGRRVRVPTHCLWQDEKVREAGSGSAKAGTQITLRKTYVDTLHALNDRQTVQMSMLIGNGLMLVSKVLNLVSIESASMVVSVSGGRLILTAGSTLDQDFVTKFEVGDVVQLAGFIVTSGADPNVGYWKVAVVTAHLSTPSRIELDPFTGQVVAGIVATAGTAFSPASIRRTDDVFFATTVTVTGTGTVRNFQLHSASHLDPTLYFRMNDTMVVSNAIAPYADVNGVRNFRNLGTDYVVFTVNPSAAPIGGPSSCAAAGAPVQVRFQTPPRFAAGYFPSTFDPDANFHNGAADQAEDAVLAAAKGTGTVPAYRGVAYQTLTDFFVTDFGDQQPFAMEALIDPDAALTWAQAFALVMERGGVPSDAIDTSGVTSRPFLGYYVRGALPGVTGMQPLLVASGCLTQDRDGVLCVFNVENADAVQVENDATLTDLQVVPFGSRPADTKLRAEDVAEEDLPTFVGVRHQDPDNLYADGYQSFGRREPNGVGHSLEVELDLSAMVLTRREAKDLATTHHRREWTNRRRYRDVLGPNYLDLLENDLVTVTDDDGNDLTLRLIQRDYDMTFRMPFVAVEEDVDLAVTGSPVVSGAASIPPLMFAPAALRTSFVDVPAITNDDLAVPQMLIATCPIGGAPFAGAQLWESRNGANFVRVGDIVAQAGIGDLVGTLSAQSASEAFGTTTVSFRSQTVDVEFDALGWGLESATDAEALAGKNWVALIAADGSVEVAAFCTIAFVSGTTWTLGRWLRGLRGTSPIAQAAGTVCVFLTPLAGNGLFRRQFPGDDLTTASIVYKIVPTGLSLEDVPAQGVTLQWRNLRPLPVRSVSKTIGASPFDAQFEVAAQWCRQMQPLGTQPPHPIDDLPEAYRFTIYDPTGTQVRRVIVLSAAGTGSNTLRDRWIDYTAAQQTADGYTPSGATTFTIDVQQIGAGGLLGPSTKQVL